MLATHSIHAPHRAASSSFRSLGKLPCSHTTPPEPYRAVFPAVRPRSDPDVANLYPVALAALAATLRTRRTSPDQSTFLHVPAIRQSHAEPPIPPCLPLTASVPRTGRRRVPSGRSESSLAVTPRRPNPIAPSSLRSDRATYSGADLPSVAPHRRFGYHAACPAVRPRSTPLAVADVSTVRSLRSPDLFGSGPAAPG